MMERARTDGVQSNIPAIRPSIIKTSTSSESAALGLDIGNTNHTAALVSSSGEALEILRGRTDRTGGPEALLRSLSMLLPDLVAAGAERGLQLSGLGVGFGGPVDSENGRVVLSHQNPGWEDFPLRDRLRELTHLPVVLDNDANAGGLGEFRFGAGRGLRDIVYYNIGTGIGGAVILDGRLRRGAAGLAGELGHTTVRPGGPVCTCGQRGCLEAVSSGSAIARQIAARAIAWQGRLATADDFFPLVSAGNSDALEILAEVIEGLSLSIRNVLHLLNPEGIILGGGVAGGGDLLLIPLREAVHALAFPEAFRTCRIASAELGYYAGVIGAAALVMD